MNKNPHHTTGVADSSKRSDWAQEHYLASLINGILNVAIKYKKTGPMTVLMCVKNNVANLVTLSIFIDFLDSSCDSYSKKQQVTDLNTFWVSLETFGYSDMEHILLLFLLSPTHPG